MRRLLTSLSLLCCLSAVAQVKVTTYGFVRNYIDMDSRAVYTVVGGEYSMFPYDNRWDSSHSVDLNAIPHIQLQALSSRVGLRLQGPNIWGMQSGGLIEGDFGGFGTTNTVFRIRHAYFKLSKKKEFGEVEYLAGQTWHPLSGEVMPRVVGMASGAPFRPHSRTPQLRATAYRGNWGIIAAMMWQLQYMNNGPASVFDASSVPSTSFAHNNMVPEVFIGLNYKHQSWYAQFGLNSQVITPRSFAPDPNNPAGAKYVSERVGSITPTLFVSYTSQLWNVQARTILASNTSHLNQPVGYAVTGVNYSMGSWEYAPMHASISYIDVAYGKTIVGNIFVGILKNLGCREALHDFSSDLSPLPVGVDGYLIYMYGGNTFAALNSVWRIAPSFSYKAYPLSLGIEYEITGATYGDIGDKGAILLNDNLHQVVNHRLCLMAMYQF